MTSDERIAELEAENAALREQVTVLAERLHELEARLAKDSYNSSKPLLSSLSKQGMKRLAALESLFTGRPLDPSFT